MKEAILKKIKLDKADVVILNVPYEKTVSGGKKTADGPKAICDMLKYQVEEWDHLLKKHTSKKIDIAEKNLRVQNIERPNKMIEIVKKEAFELINKKKFVVTLGGEHTVSLGSIGAAKKIFKDLTIVHLDAHADLRDDNSDYEDNPRKITKFAHSCVMRRVYELGCQAVQVGIRSMSPMEYSFAKKNGLEKNIFYCPLKAGYEKIISKIKTKKVYLTIDVDGFDPAVFPATGTPEPGGLGWDWTLGFFQKLFSKKEVVGMDIVEVAPRKGDARTEFAAAKLLYHLIGLKFLDIK